MTKKLLLNLTGILMLSAIFGLSACGGDSGGGAVREVPPTTLDIAEETIEATQNVPFQVNVGIGWENWEWGPDVTPGSNIIWTLRTEEFEEPVNARQIQMETNESGDGWLRYYFTYEIVVDRLGEGTLTATSHTNSAVFDTVQITVLENQNQGGGDGGNDGGEDEYQACAEENLGLELVDDHYVVTGLGSYELGSTGMGTYSNYPNSLIIINKPNGIPITEIADSAFAGNTQITHFESATVTKIGDGVFENCASLQGVYLQETTGPLEIGDSAFKGCESMEEILTTNIKSVGEYAFAGLEKLDYASGVGLCFRYEPEATIGAHAFEGCTAFTYLDGGAEDLVVGEYAFAGCSGISSVNFACAALGDYALSGCTSITGVSLGLKTVGKYTFAGREDLVRVTFTERVENIAAYAFENFKLNSVQFQKGVNTISEYAFKGCQNLEIVESSGDIGVIGERAFDNCRKMYRFTVEGSVGEVQASAFSSCGYDVGDKYLNWGYKYLSYHVTEGTKILRSGAMAGAMLYELDLTKTELIEGDRLSFGGEVRLTLPSYYTEIPDSMFEACHGLYGITFTSAITKIGSRAFVGCKLSDADFEIPDSVTRIGDSAFANCSLTNGELPFGLTYIGEKAFYGKTNFVNTTVCLPAALTEIGESAFAETRVKKVIGGGLIASTSTPFVSMKIGKNVFQNCTALEEIDFTFWDQRNGTYHIGENMFDGCTALKNVDLGYVSHIGVGAFKGCTALTSFRVLPNNRSGEYYENTANAFVLSSIKKVLYLADLADAEAMAENVKSGMYDEAGWQATKY